MLYLIFVLYNGIFIPLFYSAIRIVALFNHKVSLGLNGRQLLFKTLREKMAMLPAGHPRVWIHISSLGEFEQAKPVVKTIRHDLPQAQIILSFFSPSGYIPAQKYTEADIVTYLPLDTYWNARAFIDIVKPGIHLIVRHDIWPNFQWRLQKRGIPSLLIDASLTVQRLRPIRWFRLFIRPIFNTFSQILVTSAENGKNFREIYAYPEHIIVSGDTKYDQVCARALETGKIELLSQSGFFQPDRCLVAGSTWPTDEKVILPPLAHILKKNPYLKLIIAPHETTEEHILGIEAFLAEQDITWVRLSHFNPESPDFQVLLIDRIGLLANLYALGRLAFVGGGFGPGVHNVLEPAAHACAVFYGPRHLNSLEAIALSSHEGGKVIHTQDEMAGFLTLFVDQPQEIEQMGRKARELVEENVGASQRVVASIIQHIGSTERIKHG